MKPGDEIELTLPEANFIRGSNKTIKGRVESVFDALTPEGKEGINLEIDIRYNQDYWFRYKPAIDGGQLKILSRSENE